MNSKSLAGTLIGCAALLSVASSVHAQIGNPGNHLDYSVELEPHLVVQWEDEPWWDDDGIGVGLRATIPVIDNGPVTSINNSLGIGFGLDWAHFDDACWGPGPRPRVIGDECSADDFWVPVVVQWNFFFSDLVSAFPELGLGIQHSRWDGDWCGGGRDLYRCGDGDRSDTDVDLVLWLGVRFHLADHFALTLRIGTPSLLLGASFFL
jgi:hypothetical protein